MRVACQPVASTVLRFMQSVAREDGASGASTHAETSEDEATDESVAANPCDVTDHVTDASNKKLEPPVADTPAKSLLAACKNKSVVHPSLRHACSSCAPSSISSSHAKYLRPSRLILPGWVSIH